MTPLEPRRSCQPVLSIHVPSSSPTEKPEPQELLRPQAGTQSEGECDTTGDTTGSVDRSRAEFLVKKKDRSLLLLLLFEILCFHPYLCRSRCLVSWTSGRELPTAPGAGLLDTPMSYGRPCPPSETFHSPSLLPPDLLPLSPPSYPSLLPSFLSPFELPPSQSRTSGRLGPGSSVRSAYHRALSLRMPGSQRRGSRLTGVSSRFSTPPVPTGAPAGRVPVSVCGGDVRYVWPSV